MIASFAIICCLVYGNIHHRSWINLVLIWGSVWQNLKQILFDALSMLDMSTHKQSSKNFRPHKLFFCFLDNSLCEDDSSKRYTVRFVAFELRLNDNEGMIMYLVILKSGDIHGLSKTDIVLMWTSNEICRQPFIAYRRCSVRNIKFCYRIQENSKF